MSYINHQDAYHSNISETFETIQHLAAKMNELHDKLKRPDGVETARFFEEMQMISDRLNRTLYMAEDAMKIAQAKQRIKEMDNADKKKLEEENEKLKRAIDHNRQIERDFVLTFRKMDSQRETRTMRGLSTILDKLLIVYPQMTVSMLKVFITVCQYPGLSLSDYCGKTGMARSTVSRHLLHLGPKINKGKAKSSITAQEEAAKKYDFMDRGHDIEEGGGYTKGLDLIRYGKSMDGVSNFYAPSEKGSSLLKLIKENIYASLHAIYEDNFLRAYGEDDVISREEDPEMNMR